MPPDRCKKERDASPQSPSQSSPVFSDRQFRRYGQPADIVRAVFERMTEEQPTLYPDETRLKVASVAVRHTMHLYRGRPMRVQAALAWLREFGHLEPA